MSTNEISDAIKQICEEKNISYESVIDTISQALAAAYRKDFGEKNQNIHAEFNPETGKTRVFDIKTVVEDVPEEELEELEELVEGKKSEKDSKVKTEKVEKNSKEKGEKKDEDGSNKKVSGAKSDVQSRTLNLSKDDRDESKKEESSGLEVSEEDEKPRFNPRTDIQISDAKKLKKSYKIDDEIKTKLEIPAEFGRMAAQTAKQVIIQRLREAERDVLYKEFKDKEGQVLTGIVQRQEGRLVLIDLGATTAIIPPDQQIQTENYNSGQRYRVYLSEVRETSKGPEIVVSRTNQEIVKQVFILEVPEIASGSVEIKAISREAGSRSKIAVYTDDESIDPIGSCVGQRGTRIQTIITELGGEKLDIIQYNDDPAKFITNALSPAKVVSVDTNEKEKIAHVKVRADQLSLAIGKAGQNVRLAAKLTGWKIDIAEAPTPGAKSGEEEKGRGEEDESSKSVDTEKGKEKEEKKDDKDKGDIKNPKSDDAKKEKKASGAESDAQPRTESPGDSGAGDKTKKDDKKDKDKKEDE